MRGQGFLVPIVESLFYSKQKERQEKNHVGEESKGARYVGLTDDYARE